MKGDGLTSCLECQERLPKTRGLCNKCYQAMLRKKRDGLTTHEQECQAGRLLPKKKSSAWMGG